MCRQQFHDRAGVRSSSVLVGADDTRGLPRGSHFSAVFLCAVATRYDCEDLAAAPGQRPDPRYD